MQAPATYIAPATPMSELLMPRPVLAGFRASDIEPTIVTSSPSRIHTVPRPTTIIQCQRAQGRRSNRAGMSVVICPVSTPLVMLPPREGLCRERRTPALRWHAHRAAGYGSEGPTRPRRDPMPDLTGRTIAFLVAPEGVEQVELTEPWSAVEDAGGTPRLLSTAPGEIQAFNHLDKGDTFQVDGVVGDVDPASYDGLVLPGGVANPDALRMDKDAVAFVRDFVDSDRPVAAICHAPWTLAEADVVRGRRLTSWPSLETDLRNAGAQWVDAEVVLDGNLVTSRKPDDLPAFTEAMVEVFAG